MIGKRFADENMAIYTTEGEVATNAYIFVLLDLIALPEVEPYTAIW